MLSSSPDNAFDDFSWRHTNVPDPSISTTLIRTIINIEDLHVGDTGTYGVWADGELDALVAHLNTYGADTTFILGDITDNGLQSQKATFNVSFGALLGTVYDLRGNHDEADSQDIFLKHFVCVLGDITFIAFYTRGGNTVSPSVVPNGVVEASELVWLEAQLQAATTPHKILLSHIVAWNPNGSHIDPAYGQAALMALCEQYGVVAMFSGHSHQGVNFVVNGVNYYNGYAAIIESEGYQEMRVYSDRIDMYRYKSRTPFALKSTTPIRFWFN